MSVESPCIRVCTLDESGQLCMGCFRTIEEIGLWAQLTDTARSRVVGRAALRRRDHESGRPAARSAAQLCEACGAEFSCGASDPIAPCWCVGYPSVAPRGPDATCLCPACLATAAR